MSEVASAFVSLLPSAKGFGSKLDKEIGGEVNSSGKRSGKLFGTVMMGAAGAAVGGAVALGAFLKGSLDEAREAQKVGALTNQVIKSTGGVANVTAKQVGSLAGAISAKTGIDDEAIQSASNLLLTFTNVRNEVGKGNDIFNQATQAATDMGAALGKEPKAASIALGKALNDPVKGVTALSKVGVSFTEQQKAQIKTLVASGKTVDAQKMILGELRKEFGGAAEASATAGDKFKVAFGNLQESVGTALLPLVDMALGGLTKLAVFATNNVGPAFAKIGTFLAPAKAAIAGLFASFTSGGGASGLLTTFKTIGSAIVTNFLPVLRTAATTFTTVVLPAVLRVAGYLQANLVPVFKQVGSIIATQVVPIVASLARFFYGTLYPAVVRIVTAIATQLKPVFDQLFRTIQGSVLPTVQRLLAKFREWQPTIQKVITVVLKVVGVVLVFAATILGKVLPPLIRFAGFLIRNVVGALAAVVGGIIKAIGWIVRIGTAFVKAVTFVVRFQTGVLKMVVDVVRTVAGIPGKVLSALGNLGSRLFGAGQDLIRGLINGVKNMAGQVAKAAGDVVGNAISAAKRKLGIHSPSKVFHKIGEQTGQGLLNGLKKSLTKAKDRLESDISALVDKVQNLQQTAADFASGIADKFRGDLFAGGLAEFDAQLRLDTQTANAFSAALSAAAAKGLSGGLYQTVAASGNVQVASELANLSKAQIKQQETLFNIRENAVKAAGQTPADRIYGDTIQAQLTELKGLRADLATTMARLEHVQTKIEVHDKSGSPKKTAKEVSRQMAHKGGG